MTRVQAVDPTGPDLDRWYDLYVRSFDRPFDQPWTLTEKRVRARDDRYVRLQLVLLLDDMDLPVAGGWLELPQRDNRETAFAGVFVSPAMRRRGYGSRLGHELIDRARAVGRRRLLGEAVWPVGERTGPAAVFAEHCGAELDLLYAQRELRLPASVPAAPVADGYTVATWRDACPDAWVEQYAVLRSRLASEAPQGRTPLEDEFWDPERVRADERSVAEQGRTMQVTVAVHTETGLLAGHTQLAFPGESVEVYQWDTLVLPEHRGHGLGLSLKAHTMRVSADLLAGRTRIHTDNAASNRHMIAVNEALGFVQVAWVGEYARAC